MIATAPPSPAPALDTPRAPAPRVVAVDVLRGLVMVVMVLDHTRDYSHSGAFRFDPLDLTQTTLPLFFTRWVTHFCAPTFVFLAGTSVYLRRLRGTPVSDIARFLWTRGLWLIVLEFTVVRLGMTFTVDYHFLGFAQVIWTLGVSMIVLAALVHLSPAVVGALGMTMIATHDLFDGITVAPWRGPGTAVPSAAGKLWMVLHQKGFFPVAGPDSPALLILYPLVPWIEVLAAGYAFGSVYERDIASRRRLIIRLGIAITAAFVVLRVANVYGDPARWSAQATHVLTMLSFLNVSKYPPSLLYLMATLGPALIDLGWLDGRPLHSAGRGLALFGSVPLFFYLLQWGGAHGIAWVAFLAAGKPTSVLVLTMARPSPADIAQAGFSLPVVYGFWAIIIVLLYPLCRWYAGIKRRRHDWWLSYL